MSAYFERTTVPNSGKPSRGFKIQCGHCAFNGAIALNSSLSGESEARVIQRKFEAIGWKIAKSQTQHRCPKCFSAIKNAAIVKSQKAKEMTPATVEPPREMGREDKRLIFAKIHEVYGDNSYLESWTDAKVAADLGVPRAWVKSVRETDFGDEGRNEEIKEAIAEAKRMLGDVRAVAPKADAIMEELRKLCLIANKVEKTVAEIVKGLK